MDLTGDEAEAEARQKGKKGEDEDEDEDEDEEDSDLEEEEIWKASLKSYYFLSLIANAYSYRL